jgi:hypothetical protein
MRAHRLVALVLIALAGCTTSAQVAESARQSALNPDWPAALGPRPIEATMHYEAAPGAPLHNIHFLWAAATMDGRSSEAVTAARQVATKVPPGMAREMPMVEYFMPTPYFALVRFGRWEEILAEPAPPDDLLYDTAMWHYARGLAYAATNRFDQALQEESTLKALAAQIPTDRIVGDNQPADMLLRLASLSLAGEIAARQGNCERAIPKLEEAVSVQDGLPHGTSPRRSRAPGLSGVSTMPPAGEPRKTSFRGPAPQSSNGWALFWPAQRRRALDARSKRVPTLWRDADAAIGRASAERGGGVTGKSPDLQ